MFGPLVARRLGMRRVVVAPSPGLFSAAGLLDGVVRHRRLARLRYHGQSFELTVPLPSDPFGADAVAALAEAFGAEHERTYGHRAGAEEPMELVSLAVLGQGPAPPEASAPRDAAAPVPTGQRAAYFGPDAGWHTVDLLRREDLSDEGRAGPLIVEEYDATLVVPPGAVAFRDPAGNLVVEV